VSNVTDSVPPRPAGHVPLSEPEAVDTVDECAFVVPAAVFAQFQFDERTCDGWHLYAVEYSLRVRAAGLQAWVLPLALYHRSGGAVLRVLGFVTFERAYFRALRRVFRKHAGVDRLHTTCGTWEARRSLLLQQFPPRLVWRAVSARRRSR
jgi:hypothetical protein